MPTSAAISLTSRRKEKRLFTLFSSALFLGLMRLPQQQKSAALRGILAND
jgi:hypothetical protein